MLKIQFLLIVFSILLLIDFKDAFQNSRICKLGINSKKFIGDIESFQVICTVPQKKKLDKIWSSVELKIVSNSPCHIKEDVNKTAQHHKERFSTFSKLLSILKSFHEKPHERCNTVISVPVFNEYCVEVELNGQLEVYYDFKYVDIRIVIIFLVAFLIYYNSTRLSKSEFFHYFSGTLIGVFGSILILLLILVKYIPKKTVAVVTFFSGTSFFLFLTKTIYLNFRSLNESLQFYFIIYLIFSSLISISICYYHGPVQNLRALNMIDGSLKLFSIFILNFGTSDNIFFISTLIAFFVVNYSYKYIEFLNIPFLRKIKNIYFPEKRRFLTHDEYVKEGQEYTLKAIQELREYCKSSECNAWKTLSKISKPEKFAKFVIDGSFHVSDEEIFDYENYSISNDLIDENEE